MGRKKTHEEYVNQVAAINPNIEVIEKYNGLKNKILHRCKIDGYEWYVTPDSILQGHGCPLCYGNVKRTQQQYEDEVEKINPNIEVVDKYINVNAPILHRCKIDGYEWKTAPANILSGKGCPKCAGNIKYTNQTFREKLYNINPNIEVIGDYTNMKHKVLCRCIIDGYEWNVDPSALLSGYGCPVCAGNKKRSHQEYIEEVQSINPDIVVIEEYANALQPILHKCNKCGTEWYSTPHHILEGHGCPKCNANVSFGENDIKNFLDDKEINYIRQYTFKNCKNIKELPFDFYLFDYNACIEFDGIQHFEPIDYFGGKTAFEDLKKRDTIKTNYCMSNNIPLLRIRYDEDISSALDNFLDSLTIQNYNQEPERAC